MHKQEKDQLAPECIHSSRGIDIGYVGSCASRYDLSLSHKKSIKVVKSRKARGVSRSRARMKHFSGLEEDSEDRLVPPWKRKSGPEAA